MRFERPRVHLDPRDLPEALAVGRRVAEERGHRPAAREPGDAVPGVGLPEPVGGKLGEALQPLLVGPRIGELALAPAGEHYHDEIHDAGRDRCNEQQRVGHHAARRRCRAPAARP